MTAYPTISIALDIVLVLLLLAVIFYAVRLNRHMASLKNNRAELEALVKEFTRSTGRAETALARLKRGAGDNVREVRDVVVKAESLRDDLGFLVSRGEKIADRLEQGISGSRESAPETEKPAKTAAGRRNRSGKGTAGDSADAAADADAAGEEPEKKTRSGLLKTLQDMG